MRVAAVLSALGACFAVVSADWQSDFEEKLLQGDGFVTGDGMIIPRQIWLVKECEDNVCRYVPADPALDFGKKWPDEEEDFNEQDRETRIVRWLLRCHQNRCMYRDEHDDFWGDNILDAFNAGRSAIGILQNPVAQTTTVPATQATSTQVQSMEPDSMTFDAITGAANDTANTMPSKRAVTMTTLMTKARRALSAAKEASHDGDELEPAMSTKLARRTTGASEPTSGALARGSTETSEFANEPTKLARRSVEASKPTSESATGMPSPESTVLL